MPRPLKYKTPEQMEKALDAYFTDNERPTMAGVCVALGICKQSLSNYYEREGFSELIDFARLRVEAKVEEILLYDKAGAGAIFWLKNNAGWSDRTEQDVNVRGEFYVSDEPTIEEFDKQFTVGSPVRAADSTD